MKKYFKLLAFLTAAAQAGFAFAGDSETAASRTVIANVMARNAVKTDVILVDKDSRQLYEIEALGDGFSVSGKYPIIYGVNEGDKMVSGDGKTPEGVYYITTWRSGEKLLKMYGDYAKIYGAGSFPLNYPNPVDKIRKKTGHGIWIHGRDPVNGKSTTQGCVALHNEDLTALKEKTEIKDPVIITDKAYMLTEEEYKSKREELFALFDGFINSWKDSDYEAFKNYVHPSYRGQGKNAASYLSSKKYLMGLYKDKTIETDDTKIFIQNGGNLVVDTNQFYCAPNITSYGNKRYYFANDGGGLKLIAEEVSPLSPSSIIKERVESFVNGWAEAWRGGDAEKYIEYYSENFRNGRMGVKEWRDYKKAVFEKAGEINLEISGIRWETAGNTYKAVFTQKYSGGAVSDLGTKTLVFEGCPGSFKIISETWKAN